MPPVIDFSLTYDAAANQEGVFSAGDAVAGAVTFKLMKATKVKSLVVKMKGEARVRWSEGGGDNERTHSADRRYFKVKEHLVAEDGKGTLLPEGIHRFKFRFQIPLGNLPSSFKGVNGRIVYTLEAKLSRSWRWPSFDQRELTFVSKSFPQLGQVMRPQAGSVGKTISKGQVQMAATVDRKCCFPGDTLSITAQISNSSSKTVKPKFSLQQKTVYHASSSSTSSEKNLCKMIGRTISSYSEESFTCQMRIPENVTSTLHNCEIITVDYYLKVYLDISFDCNPEVVFPLIVAPSSFAARCTGTTSGPYPAGAVGAPSYSNFPSPAIPSGPNPAPIAGSDAYGYPAAAPTPHANMPGFHNNQFLQQPPLYGSPAAFASASVQPEALSAPPMFQEEEPPSYTSLFPPS